MMSLSSAFMAFLLTRCNSLVMEMDALPTWNALIGYIHTVPCQGQKLADAKRTGEGKVEAKLQPGILA